MANTGFFGRLSNLWRGFVSLWISDVEKKHPEIAYENAINSMIEKYTALKHATAAIIRRREDIDARYKQKSGELAQVNADLQTAVDGNQQDLGLVLIQKQKALADEVAGLQADIKGLKAEKDNMLAKMASAEARMRVQDQLEGLSVDNEVKALDNVRAHIKNTIAEANLGKELGESDLDPRLKALRATTGEANSKTEWERLRNANAAKAGQKTM